jgi:FkbM family methyltransferase
MRLILDLGAHKLEGSKKLISTYKNGSDNIHLVCWEANPFIFHETIQNAKNFSKLHNVKVECRNFAASNKKTKLKFNVDESKTSQGCNSLENPIETDVLWGTKYKWSQVLVETESIREWIDQVHDVEEIFIKCDIEGAEFEVLPDILKSKNIQLVKKIFVEWHERFWHPNENIKIQEKNKIINDYKELKIEVIEWE